MFTGLVQSLGTLAEVCQQPPGRRLAVKAAREAGRARPGDSIAVNGCCLTAVDVSGERLVFDVGPETLERTNLGQLAPGDLVNLERSLAAGDPLGGHFVTGHVDDVATVDQRLEQAGWVTLWFRCDPRWCRQMVSKGSIAVDGVSLTLVDVETDRFSVALIPHTLANTTLGQRRQGDRVNLETDLVAKYVEKLLGRVGPPA